MKKYVLASLLTGGLGISAFAVQPLPFDTHGNSYDPQYGGVSSCEISNSTGTNAVLCTTGAGIILSIFGSSVATTDNIVIRDSNTANTTSTVLLGITQASLGARAIYPRFKNGLSVNALVAPSAAGAASRPNWTVIYVTDIK